MIEPDDKRISLESLKAGDREAFARLVDETSGHVYRVALQILGDEQDAEDRAKQLATCPFLSHKVKRVECLS